MNLQSNVSFGSGGSVSFFSADAEKHIAALVEAAFGVNEEIKLGAAFLPFKIPHWIPTPGRRRFARSLKMINDFVYGVISERRKAANAGDDFAGLFVAAREKDVEGGMNDVQVRDELVTILNAGHDTVTDSIVWTMVLLSRHPAAKEEARAEVRRIAGSGPLTTDSVMKMDFLGRVFHESLRLYPPGWAFARTALNEDSFGEYSIPAGALVIMSPYVVHRSRRFWPDPEKFDPDRFLPERTATRQKFTYFPFGAGPRQCIGAGLVMMEAPLILASILQRCDFEVFNAAGVEPLPRISLRRKGSVTVRVTPL